MDKLTQEHSFLRNFERAVRECWDKPALIEYNASSITYGELAAELEKTVLWWRAAGLQPGDKIAINARSSASWGKAFFAAQTGGFVAVQLFNGFTPADTQRLVNHSDSRILYTEKAIFEKMDFEAMPLLLGAIDTKTGELLASRGAFADIYASRDALFFAAHPAGLRLGDVQYPDRPLDELCALMYTSGSTGNPKGVMITIRNFSSHIYMIPSHFPYKREDNYVSVLPYAHIFGLVYDLMAPLCYGMSLCILCVPPVPANLKPALRTYRPYVFFAVPLILNKMLDDSIGEFVRSKSGSAKLADFEHNPDFCEALRTIFMNALGGNIGLYVTGGAAMPEALEKLLVQQLKTPFVTGYGMTEATPSICLGNPKNYKLKECGQYVDEVLDLKIDSPDPEHIPGEVLIRGHVVFAGYYKNPEATRNAFTPDGWFRTGDLGTVDKDKAVFLVGRCKSMILGADGQNIFPEEIEVVLNQLPYIQESLIVGRSGHLTALIVPDQNLLAEQSIGSEELDSIMNANLSVLNSKIPGYSAVGRFEIQAAPFAKTPKGSIKRFMYK